MSEIFNSLKQKILKKIQSNGLNIAPIALDKLAKFGVKNEETADSFCEKLISFFIRSLENIGLINEEIALQAIREIESNSNKKKLEIKIVSAFEMDRLNFDMEKRTFTLTKDIRSESLGNQEDYLFLYRRRYQLLFESLIRSKTFTDPQNQTKLLTIFQIKNSLPSSRSVTFGLLSVSPDGNYYLYDIQSILKLDISNAFFVSQLIVLDSFYIVEGYFLDNVFIVETIGIPPTPNRDILNIDNSKREIKEILQIDHKNINSDKVKMIFFSDTWLDKADVVFNLQKCLQTLSQNDGYKIFVFCGNFQSSENSMQFSKLKESLRIISKLKKKFLSKDCPFIILPGPTDPGLTSVLPRHEFSDSIIEGIDNLIFCTNPVRINIRNKNILVLREEIFEKIAKCSIKCPNNTKSFPKEFAKFCISQDHICSLPLYSRPILWQYDHSFSLSPAVNMVVIALNYSHFVEKTNLCTFVNPGCFSTNGYKHFEHEFKV